MLRTLLGSVELGTWALDPETLEFLWARVQQDRPLAIVECGAGTSTLVLAAYADHVRRVEGHDVRIVSVEQNAEVRESVEERLERVNLRRHVEIIETPTAADGSYILDLESVSRALPAGMANWILIDGPAGPNGCRTSTLPQLQPICGPGTRWYLDDAFRDGELRTLQTWVGMPSMTVAGIYPVGKGVATGLISPSYADVLSATTR